jgi:signal transduction histidine kinase
MKNKNGIRHRWLVNNVRIMVLVVLAVVMVATLASSSYYYSCMQSGLKAKLQATADFFETYVSSSAEEFYNGIYGFTRSQEEKDTLEMEFLSTQGEILSSSFGLTAGTRPQTDDVQEALTQLDISVFTGKDPGTGERIMAVSGPVYYTSGEVAGVLRYVTSLREADRRILWQVGTVVVLAMVVMLLIWATGLYFIHSIVNPVTEITDTAKRIAAGGYGTQIQKRFAEGEDEIGELTRAINNLSLQISQTEKMQSEFLSSVSHELRTPLTAISGWGETLLTSEAMDPAETRRGIVTMVKETRRLTSLVEELLEFSRIQDGRFKLNVEECDLRGVFEDTIFMYGSRLRQEGMALEYQDSDEDIPEISCDPERMKQVFLNILDNAAKYGGAGGRIVCAITGGDQEVVVTIRDFGPGIPQEELPLVKKKFYKGSSKARGSGIGLAVCEEIVTMHGGVLDIANAQDGQGGCEVTIHLPM